MGARLYVACLLYVCVHVSHRRIWCVYLRIASDVYVDTCVYRIWCMSTSYLMLVCIASYRIWCMICMSQLHVCMYRIWWMYICMYVCMYVLQLMYACMHRICFTCNITCMCAAHLMYTWAHLMWIACMYESYVSHVCMYHIWCWRRHCFWSQCFSRIACWHWQMPVSCSLHTQLMRFAGPMFHTSAFRMHLYVCKCPLLLHTSVYVC